MKLRIGTRKSPLALAQSELVKQALLAADTSLGADDIELVAMVTSGDIGNASDAGQWGLKGLFTKELEEALLTCQVDIAVHSMKDMPSVLPEGLIIAAMLAREDVRDGFISLHHKSLDSMPQGVIIGTSSTRRAAQIKRIRPDIHITGFRGNVGTRLGKLEAGEVAATLLAVAGLNRLGLATHITEALDTERMLPAIAQGAVGIECRENDTTMRERLKRINHAATFLCVETERSLLKALDGSCRSPIAAYAQIDGNYISLRAQVLAVDGSDDVTGHIMAPLSDGLRIGRELGLSLKSNAAYFLVI